MESRLRHRGARGVGAGSPGPGTGRREGGASLLEMAVALAVLGLLVLALAPELGGWTARRGLKGATRTLALQVDRLCATAVASGRAHGLRFDTALPGWTEVADGDGDGVRSADVVAGVDPALGPPVRLGSWHPGVALDRPPGVPPVGGGSPGSGGVAFGSAGILSCSAAGATAGTLYLRNRNGEGAAVRVYGPTARISLWWWPRGGPWQALPP